MFSFFFFFLVALSPLCYQQTKKQKQSRIETISSNFSYYSTHGNIESLKTHFGSLKTPQGSYYLEVQK
jgi:D-alanyl-lipoteichoic acid acyltransferase DltB (MBOAT superfamily)